jgi:F0F1-type ATP synthase membrane subunit b/b'
MEDIQRLNEIANKVFATAEDSPSTEIEDELKREAEELRRIAAHLEQHLLAERQTLRNSVK